MAALFLRRSEPAWLRSFWLQVAAEAHSCKRPPHHSCIAGHPNLAAAPTSSKPVESALAEACKNEQATVSCAQPFSTTASKGRQRRRREPLASSFVTSSTFQHCTEASHSMRRRVGLLASKLQFTASRPPTANLFGGHVVRASRRCS